MLAVRGTVFTESAGSRKPLTANALVRRGDAIVSTAGKAKIALEDGSIVSVGENTRVRIDEYQRESRNVKARLALVAGALRLFVAKVTPDGNFEVETETAIAAVRGTDWLIGDDAGTDLGCAAARPGCGVRSRPAGRSDRRTGVARARNGCSPRFRTHAADAVGRAASGRPARACHVQLAHLPDRAVARPEALRSRPVRSCWRSPARTSSRSTCHGCAGSSSSRSTRRCACAVTHGLPGPRRSS